MIKNIAIMASLNNLTVLQTQTLIKTFDSTPLIPFENHFIVQLDELIENNNNNHGVIGAANRFDLGGEDRAPISESVSAC